MKKTILLFSALLIFGNLSAQDKAALVNPIIGTDGMGHTFPGACVPFGLVQLSPDTDTIPHNVDGKYSRVPMNIVPAINIRTAVSSGSAIRISAEPDIPTSAIS